MAAGKNINGVWRALTAWLFGLVLAGGGTWLTWGQHSITRAQVSEMIRVESPYIEDRRALRELLQNNTSSLERLSEAVEELKVEQAKLIARFDTYLEQRTIRRESSHE